MAEAPEQAIPEAVMREADAVTDAIGAALINHLKAGNDAPANGLMPPIIASALIAAELRGREAQKEADARIAEREIIGIFFDGDRQEELSRARDARNGTARRIATTIRNS